MTSVPELEIVTIYSGAAVKRSSLRLHALGVCSLLAAAAWMWITWWPADRFLERTITLATIRHALGPNSLNRVLGPPPAAMSGQPDDAEPANAEPADAAPDSVRSFRVLGVDMYVWLTVMTVTGGWLALAGGSALFGTAGIERARRTVLLLLVFCVVAGIAGGSWAILAGPRPIPARYVRWTMITILVVCGLTGMLMPRRALTLHRGAAYLIIIASVATLLCVWVAVRWGQMPGGKTTPTFYARAFVIQSSYAWVILLGTIGLR